VTASCLKVCEVLRDSFLAREDDGRTGFQRLKIAPANFVLQEDWVMNGEEGREEHDARLVLSSLQKSSEKSHEMALQIARRKEKILTKVAQEAQTCISGTRSEPARFTVSHCCPHLEELMIEDKFSCWF
jgi:hypothetical protein